MSLPCVSTLDQEVLLEAGIREIGELPDFVPYATEILSAVNGSTGDHRPLYIAERVSEGSTAVEYLDKIWGMIEPYVSGDKHKVTVRPANNGSGRGWHWDGSTNERKLSAVVTNPPGTAVAIDPENPRYYRDLGVPRNLYVPEAHQFALRPFMLTLLDTDVAHRKTRDAIRTSGRVMLRYAVINGEWFA